MVKYLKYISVFLILFSLCFATSCKRSGKSRSTAPSKSVKKSDSGKQNESSSGLVKTARSYVGTPYRMGGTTRAGMDCSGLMLTTFKSQNITLPRTSAAQSQIGQKVSISNLQPGDLVFFTDRKGGRKVTHVGMVTNVRGEKDIKFIHASTKLGVVESDLFASYYISIFLFAKRVGN